MPLERGGGADHGVDMCGRDNLRDGDREVGGSCLPRVLASVVTNRSSVRRLRAWNSRDIGLMRMPMKSGSVPANRPRRDFLRRRLRVTILLGVGPRAVAVFEIETEISTGSRLSLARTRSRTVSARSDDRPNTLAKADAVGANSSSLAMAAAPKSVRRNPRGTHPRRKSTCGQVAVPCDRPDRRPPVSHWRCAAARQWAAIGARGSSWPSRRLR